MAASGIAVSDSCKEMYSAVKIHKSKQSKQPKLAYAVFKIRDDLKEIVVDRVCQEGHDSKGKGEHQDELSDFDSLVQSLPADDGRYFVYDYHCNSSFGPTSKIILFLWCPGNAPVKKKMLYASSKDALKKCLNHDGKVFEADCYEDLRPSEIAEKFLKM